MQTISIFPINGIPLIKANDNIGEVISNCIEKDSLRNGDVIICCHTIISKAENQVFSIQNTVASDFAKSVAKLQNKDERLIEIILNNSKRVVRMTDNSIICETPHGFICANAGCDESNTEQGTVLALPKNPNLSAQKIRTALINKHSISKIAVIISDTIGRPHRKGAINVAIGSSGISAVQEVKAKDLYNRTLEKTVVATADQLASTAGLLMGESNEGLPVVVIRGAKWDIQSQNELPLSRAYEHEIFN